MSAFTPTKFSDFDTKEAPNQEQVACKNAFESVKVLPIFEERLFKDVGNYQTNHLLTWCIEVLIAQDLGCFNSGTGMYEHAGRILGYRLKQMFAHGSQYSYSDPFLFKIDWNSYWQLAQGLPSNFGNSLTPIPGKDQEFICQLESFRQLRTLESFLLPTLPASVLHNTDLDEVKDECDDVKMGEDLGPVVISDEVNTVHRLLDDPFLAIIPKRRYFRKITRQPLAMSSKNTSKHGRRTHDNHTYVKGYADMPRDRAQFDNNTGTFKPTIFIDSHQADLQFLLDFPKHERIDGFMISCLGTTLLWDKQLDDFVKQNP